MKQYFKIIILGCMALLPPSAYPMDINVHDVALYENIENYLYQNSYGIIAGAGIAAATADLFKAMYEYRIGIGLRTIDTKIKSLLNSPSIRQTLKEHGVTLHITTVPHSGSSCKDFAQNFYDPKSISFECMLTLHDIQTEKYVGHLRFRLVPHKKTGSYDYLWVDPLCRKAGYADLLIHLAVVVMNAFGIQHRTLRAFPQDKTIRVEDLVDIYQKRGATLTGNRANLVGYITGSSESVLMEWSAKSPIRAKL